MATHSSILAWRIPWTEELGRLWSIGSQRVRHNWSDFACTNLNIIKATYDKPTANIILNSEKLLRNLPLRLGTRQGCPLSLLSFNIVLEVLATAIKEEKERKGIQIGKEVQLLLFADDMILHIENSKNSSRKLSEPTNKFNNVLGHKINIHKPLVCLHTNIRR